MKTGKRDIDNETRMAVVSRSSKDGMEHESRLNRRTPCLLMLKVRNDIWEKQERESDSTK